MPANNELMSGDDVQAALDAGTLKLYPGRTILPDFGSECFTRDYFEANIRHLDMSASGIAANEEMAWGEMTTWRDLSVAATDVTPNTPTGYDASAGRPMATIILSITHPAAVPTSSGWTMEVWMKDESGAILNLSYTLKTSPPISASPQSVAITSNASGGALVLGTTYSFKIRYKDAAGFHSPYSSYVNVMHDTDYNHGT